MVYGVFGGCYSDWFVIGYFTDKAKAEAFCERANETAKTDDRVYVRELPNLETEEVAEGLISVRVDTEDWEVQLAYTDMDEIIDYGGGYAAIYMMLYPSQYDRAVKIAQDRWAQYKAQKEGIV